MSETHAQRVVQFYDTHPINEDQIMEKIAAAVPGTRTAAIAQEAASKL